MTEARESLLPDADAEAAQIVKELHDGVFYGLANDRITFLLNERARLLREAIGAASADRAPPTTGTEGRIARIRHEELNGGEISAKDIDWLCDVVEEAMLVRRVAQRGFGYGWRRFDSLLRGATKE